MSMELTSRDKYSAYRDGVWVIVKYDEEVLFKRLTSDTAFTHATLLFSSGFDSDGASKYKRETLRNVSLSWTKNGRLHTGVGYDNGTNGQWKLTIPIM